MKKLSTLIILFFIGQLSLNAQTWTDISFPSTGARINDINEAPNGDLYAISSQGLFKSTDNGATWTERTSHVSGIEILTITQSGYILYEDGQYIMRLTPSNTIEYITNYAAFSTAEAGSASMVSFSDNTILMAKKVGYPTYSRAYISTDEGATFTEISSSLPSPVNNASIGSVSFYKHMNSDLVYYVGRNDSVYKSTDKGQTFTPTGGMINPWGLTNQQQFQVTASGDIYALSNVSSTLGVYKSTDQGATFVLQSTLPLGASALFASDNNVYVTPYTQYLSGSLDGGVTWTNMGSLFPKDDSQSMFNIRVPNDCFMKSDGTFFGMYDGKTSVYTEPIVKIANDNSSVSNSSVGIDMSVVHDASYNNSRLAASLHGWVHYSDDNGVTWNPLRGNGGWSHNACVTSNGTIYTLSTVSYGSGVYKQDANDSTIELFENGNTITNANDIIETSQGSIIVSTLNNIYYSTDGTNFNISTNALTSFNGVELWEDVATNRIYAAVFETGETAYSDDEGATWVTGTLAGSYVNNAFKGLHGVWTASFPDKLYHSTDVQNWSLTPSAVLVLNTNKDNIFEGQSGIYYAAEDHRIYKSTDDFVSRTLLEDGIDSLLYPDYNATSMKYYIPSTNFQGENGKLMLSVQGSLYLMDENGASGIEEQEMGNVLIYPNPTHGQFNLNSDKEIASVTISNLLGKQVMNKTINGNSTILNIEELPKGIYVVNIQFSEGNLTKKIIVE